MTIRTMLAPAPAGLALSAAPVACPKPAALGTVWDDGHDLPRRTAQGLESFAPDLPRAGARTLFGTQGPLTTSTVGDRITRAAWRPVPSWYIVAATGK